MSNEVQEKQTLEQNLEQLQEIISGLEKGELSLEEAFTGYSKGMELVRECNSQIDAVEKKVLALRRDGSTEEFE